MAEQMIMGAFIAVMLIVIVSIIYLAMQIFKGG